MATGIVLSLAAALLLMPVQTQAGNESGQNGVDLRWQGRQVVITNNNDYPIFDVSLAGLAINGLVAFGWMVIYPMTITEILPGGSVAFHVGLNMLIGLGPATLVATVSYIDQGAPLVGQAFANVMLLGPFVFFMP
jgi:hypothetical protein